MRPMKGHFLYVGGYEQPPQHPFAPRYQQTDNRGRKQVVEHRRVDPERLSVKRDGLRHLGATKDLFVANPEVHQPAERLP